MKLSKPNILAISIFFSFLSFYILIAGGNKYSVDGVTMYRTTETIVRDHRFSLLSQKGVQAVPSPIKHGRFYGKYGILQSLVQIPLYVVGASVATQTGISKIRGLDTPHFFVSFTNAFITALSCSLIFLFANSLGLSFKTSFLCTLIFGLGTLAMPYSKYDFSEPLQSLLLLLSLYTLFIYKKSKKMQNIFVAGIAFGSLLATKIIHLILLPAFFLYLLLELKNGQAETASSTRWKSIVAFATPILASLSFIGWYNWIRFGNITFGGYVGETFTTPFYIGLYGLLLSPGRGFFIYSPPLLSSLFSIRKLFSKYRLELFLSLFIIVATVLFYSMYTVWDGAQCWGPRYLLPLVPLFVVATGFVWEHEGKRKKLRKAIILFLLIAGLSLNVVATAVNFNNYSNISRSKSGQTFTATLKAFNPYFSPIAGQWWLFKTRLANKGQEQPLKQNAQLSEFPWKSRYPGLVPDLSEVKLGFDFWFMKSIRMEGLRAVTVTILVFLAVSSIFWSLVIIKTLRQPDR